MRRLPAALALVALIGAGCGNDAAEPSSRTSSTDRPREQAVTFSQCMRDHGVSGFPDPDASGELTIDAVVNGSSLDPDAPAWKQAIDACRDLQPAGFTGRRRSADQQDAALLFAQCIRDNGVPDFPDPENGAPMVDTNRIPSSGTPGGMDALNAAMRTCGTRFGDDLGVTAP